MRDAAGEDEQELANEMADAFITKVLPKKKIPHQRPVPDYGHRWLRIIEPAHGHSIHKVKLPQNEAIVSTCSVKFPIAMDGRKICN